MNGIDLLYVGAAALTAPVWARKKREGWGERLGRIGALPEGGARPRVLLHAVSVGEAAALRGLVPVLAERADVVVSATTDTGLKRARELYEGQPGVVGVVRYPLDASWAVRRFLDAVRPDVVGLVELELWPNFLGACGQLEIPVAVVNGRLSERSFRGYARFTRVVGPLMFGRLAAAGVQDGVYAQRFAAVGTPEVRVLGSMKWDAVNADVPVPGARAVALGEAMGIDRSRPVIVAGSTGPGEEALLHAACPAGVQLVCAPRKPERFGEAAAALPGSVRRSEGVARAGDRFVLDTIGELGAAYELADVVVVGRSFFDLHGSDPMEPAALGKAVVIGPAVSDFAGVVGALLEGDAIVRVGREGLAGVLAGLMGDAPRRRAMGERARACVRAHQGASARYAEMLLGLAGG